MPQVGKKKYPYTKKGTEDAKNEAKRKGLSIKKTAKKKHGK